MFRSTPPAIHSPIGKPLRVAHKPLIQQTCLRFRQCLEQFLLRNSYHLKALARCHHNQTHHCPHCSQSVSDVHMETYKSHRRLRLSRKRRCSNMYLHVWCISYFLFVIVLSSGATTRGQGGIKWDIHVIPDCLNMIKNAASIYNGPLQCA